TERFPFAVEVTDSTGDIITVPFNALVADDREQESGIAFGAFEVMVAVPPEQEVTSLRIIELAGGRVFAAIRRSQPPSIRIIAPQEGALLGGETEVAWEVRDPDTPDTQLLYQVAYSPDDGLNWVPIAVDVPGTMRSIVFNSTEIQQSPGQIVSGAPAMNLYVGYLDNLRGSPNPAETPTPFDPDANTILISTGGVDTRHDTGVLRFENRTSVPMIIDPGLQVTTEQGVFQLWDSFLPITLTPGQNLVLAETGIEEENFDTSDFGLGSAPVVSGSVNGQAFSFTDTARVLLGRNEA